MFKNGIKIIMQVHFMAEGHALDMHCRVCGGRLNRAKAKKQVVYACLEHKKDLLETFGIDVVLDTPDIHPRKFCNSCYSACKRRSTAASKGFPYQHTTEVFHWTQHQENECRVCSIVHNTL